MAIMSWNSSMSVGVAAFDNHHKRIIDLINMLHDGMLNGSGKEIMGGIFTELISYTQYHFGAEEELFRKYLYPDVLAHVQEHTALCLKVAELKKEFENDDVFISVETMVFLKEWLFHHIMEIDKKYVSFFDSYNVK